MDMKIYKAACYCRLSQDDLNDGTSVSITTQMAVAREYCKENRFQIVDFYCDDGYTGTNFNRPEFKRMMKDVEKGKVNLVIVKDLSRFGREHIMVDSYTQVYFPENGIRFIAIYDNIDITPRSHYDLMMNIKSVINEYYPAEVSGKVRNSFDVKTKNGEFLHPTVPYGYKKSSTQKNKLEIDYEYAQVIVQIFEMIAYQGIGVTNVANMLYEQKILNPTALKELKDGQIKSENPYRWNKSTIYGILNNQVYLGKMINGKTRKVSFKSDKIFKADESEWVVAENAHEPIISQELWDNAHMRVNQRKRKCNPDQPENMFKGILTCMDCDSTMRVFNPKKKSRYFVCSKSQCRVAGDFRCSTHNIKYDVLAESVLRDINLMIKMLKTNEKAFMNRVLGNIRMDEGSEERICNELSDINKQIDRQTKKYKKLYDDYYDGIIHDSKLFEEMTAECEEKRQYYLTRKSQLEEKLESSTKVFEDSERFIRLLKQYDYITELSSELLNTLIEKITVGEKTYVEPNKVVQKVKIYYKFVGLVDRCV